jgi:hypothetical protein
VSRSIRWDPHDARLFFGDDRLDFEDDYSWAHITHLAGRPAADLRAALRKISDDADWPAGVHVSDIPLALFDGDESPTGDIDFVLHERELGLEIHFDRQDWTDDDAEVLAEVAGVLAPLLSRHKASVADASMNPSYRGPPWLARATLLPAIRAKTLDELYQFARDAVALVKAATVGGITRETALDLVRGGHAHVLLGQPEGHWLDAKIDHYDLHSLPGKIALAQAAARFANAELGGLVVVGLGTKRVPGGEVIRTVSPVPLDAGMVRKYQQALEGHLFPPPDMLELEHVPVDRGMLVVIHIPPQPEELKPFLVHGAIVDGRTEGSFFSIVRRRGETSIPVTAPQVHGALAAGRALLRRGRLPDEPATRKPTADQTKPSGD